ncbi:MAG: hypothetical protein ABIV47_25085 [Roseiflexaceae bacterium]
MPTLLIHGIGQHNIADFRTLFLDVRDRLRDSVAKSRGYSVPENAFFPVYWGDWGPVAWYEGMELQTATPLASSSQNNSMDLATAIHAKSLRAFATPSLDVGLDALQIILSTPSPLQEVLDELGISASELIHAAAQTVGQPQRSTATVHLLLVRALLQRSKRSRNITARPEGRQALQALLALFLDQPQAMQKGLPLALTYPFWATVTMLVSHLRSNIMQVATSYVGDVMMYLARAAALRQYIHNTVIQACRLRPDEPLVIIAHSLGGVIAYDYAADPAFIDRPPIDLLVTMGSQVALFAEYGLFQGATSPIESGPLTHRPSYKAPHRCSQWLNFYDPADFLSFPIGRVFPGAAESDQVCEAGKPFPASHSAYWENNQLYAMIAAAYPVQRELEL